MENEMEYGYCEACGRSDVPICPSCKKLVPHGYVSGTWLPCSCGAMGQTTIDNLLANAFREYNKKGGDNE